MNTTGRGDREWAYKLGVVLPPLGVVAAIYFKSWLTGWPVGAGGAALLAVFIGLLAVCHLLSNRRIILGRLILLIWSSSAAGLLGWVAYQQIQKQRARPAPEVPAFGIGNELAGYWVNPPPWWAEYADEFRRAWHMKWHPYLRWQHQPFAGKWIRINARGQRETWSPAPPPASPHKIFTFGGSTMWGNCARDEFTIASQVAKRLHAAGIPAEVTNFGESGFVSTQELLQLMLELRSGNVPRAAVFYHGVNDIYSAFQNRETGVPQNEGSMRALMQGRLDETHLRMNPERLARDLEPAARAALTDAELIERELATYKGNLVLIEALAREYGFEALYYWQPVAFVGKPLAEEEQERLKTHKEGMGEFFRAAYARIPSLNPPGRFRDLSGVFQGVTNSFYFDLCHIKEEGNEFIARAISADLIALLGPSGQRE